MTDNILQAIRQILADAMFSQTHLDGNMKPATSVDALFVIADRTPTIRDQFAMAALAGCLADCAYFGDEDLEITASNCYRIADAMLVARVPDAS